MPVAFGSVSDIFAVSLLVKGLIVALHETRGPSAEYKQIARKLLSLDKTLLKVELLIGTHSSTPGTIQTCRAISAKVSDCREVLENFSKRTNSYEEGLSICVSKSMR
ncbi:hypothetical protein BDY21DRAFT_338070 [Lineolata rhizophorae]|uniref:Fungal N-terminal domain-containing protein n=1 Tax=Lineolata rhizophorae TaxID=578093 RepID=A0A6A6P6A3_9PEZI|nr:hypothetical protein BDY21DRAFT_338070 [Lineolata rhizophorae]